jgi:hypothetical protein
MGIIGTWKLSMNTPFGMQTPSLRIAPDGSGVLGSQAGEVPLKDLQVTANSAEFSARVPTPMGQIDVGFDVTADGNRLSGNFRTPLGLMPLSGFRTA